MIAFSVLTTGFYGFKEVCINTGVSSAYLGIYVIFPNDCIKVQLWEKIALHSPTGNKK